MERTIAGLASAALGGLGLLAGGPLGALTGVVVALCLVSAISLLVGAKKRGSVAGLYKVGGVLSAAGAVAGGIYGGWRWGWVWGAVGYVLGALVGIGGASLLRARAKVKKDEEQ